MTTLLDVLMEAASSSIFDPGMPAIHNIVAAIPSETREALEVGLLLAEVERRGPDWSIHAGFDPYYVVLGEDGDEQKAATGPTLHAALTSLLSQLPEAS